MPDFVSCPKCGCRIQMLLTSPGQRVRCVGCGELFETVAPTGPTPVEHLPPLAPVPPDDPPHWPDADRRPPRRLNLSLPQRAFLTEHEEANLPFCPGCGRRVRWEAVLCPHCEEEFEDDLDLRRRHRTRDGLTRTDAKLHRGRMIARLGNLSLALGIFAMCVGVTALAAIPIGIVAWSLANTDLEAMQNGQLNERGRRETEMGRANAVTGVVFAALFAAAWLLLWFCLR